MCNLSSHELYLLKALRPSYKTWVAVKELKLKDFPPIMENQMEKKMENEMETGGI